MSDSYLCSTCGEMHYGLPFTWGSSAPWELHEIPENEREHRVEISSDQCIIDGSKFFVLGRIEIPVINSENNFYWLAWVSVSEEDFERINELWQTRNREFEPPYPCTLSSDLPCYGPSTLGLMGQLCTQPVGDRPLIQLESNDNPLVIEQKKGITVSRVQEIAEKCTHG